MADKNFSLLVDSVVDSHYKIPFVPADIIVDGKNFMDVVEADLNKVLDWLGKKKKLKTSACPPKRFIEKFKEIKKPILVLTISSLHSGIFKSASIAAKMVKENIIVFDTKSVSLGAGILADIAEEMRRAGKKLEEVLEVLKKQREKVTAFLLPRTMENLARSGRIPELIGKIGKFLGLFPLIKVVNGKVKIEKIFRNFERGIEYIIEKTEGRALIGNIEMEEEMKEIEEKLKDKGVEVKRAWKISGALAVHIGDKAIGVAFTKPDLD